MNLVLTIKKFRKEGTSLRLRSVGDTIVVTIPKEIREALDLKAGEDIRMYPISKKKIMVEIEER